MNRFVCVALVCAVAAVSSVAAAGEWKVINGSLATTIAGISFLDGGTGYVAGAGNGVGPVILKSTNGGIDWNACPANFGADVLLLDCAAVDNSIVVTSIFGELYSDDNGASFKQSVGGGQSQSIRYIGKDGSGGNKYGATGTFKFGKDQGCAITKDGGKTFSAYNANLKTEARYGAFPTDTTYYVAAGQWPSSQPQSEPLRKSVFYTPEGRMSRNVEQHHAHHRAAGRRNDPSVGEFNGYAAELSKTTDGGQTWTSLFFENGTFYFNAIDCYDDMNCCAVGEASSDSPEAGARIHCTTDGGQNWNRTFWSPNTGKTHYSLMEIRYVSATEIWAVGGELAAIAPSAWFLHSTDGGKTWDHGTTPIFGYFAFSVSMIDSNTGFAAVDDLVTQMSGVAKFFP